MKNSNRINPSTECANNSFLLYRFFACVYHDRESYGGGGGEAKQHFKRSNQIPIFSESKLSLAIEFYIYRIDRNESY